MLLDAEAEERKVEHEGRTWLAWHTAALGRMKEMPKLAEMLGRERRAQGIDEAAIKARFAAYQARRSAAAADQKG